MKFLILILVMCSAVAHAQVLGPAGPKASSGSGEKKENVAVPYKPSGGVAPISKKPVSKKTVEPKPTPEEKSAPKQPLPFIPSKGFEPIGAPDAVLT